MQQWIVCHNLIYYIKITVYDVFEFFKNNKWNKDCVTEYDAAIKNTFKQITLIKKVKRKLQIKQYSTIQSDRREKVDG